MGKKKEIIIVRNSINVKHNKNAANYGIAANQVLFPLGNDICNLIIFFNMSNF